MNVNELFYNKDNVLIIKTELATLVGLNEAIVLNQINYWVTKNKENRKNFHDGYYWVYNSYEKWKHDFPFWSASTIKRAITALENKSLIISSNYNKYLFDKTKWYRINYEKLQQEIDNNTSGQNDPTVRSNCTNGEGQNDQTNTRDYSETSSERHNTSFPSGNMRVAEHDSLESVISRVKVLANNNFGLESYLINNLVDIFTYYFNKFHDYFIGYHPMISDDSLCKIIDKLISGSDKFEDLIYDTENYHLIIDKHFKTNYGMDIDYHMQHFATEGVLNKLSFQELY